MKVLFLSLVDFSSLNDKGIYTDLLREFIKNNHEVYVISPIEKRKRQKSYIIDDAGCTILKLKIGNIQKTNLIEKGISTIMLGGILIRGIKKYLRNVKFDLILYSTPPVTFQKAVNFVKKRDEAKTYLLLKDIWPQGIVDLKALNKTGFKGLIYKYFRCKEKHLYKSSDYIGCMSQANVDYIIKHDTYIEPDKLEICPNSIEPVSISKDDDTIAAVRKKYSIPLDKIVFIYGGNLGIPQGVDFIIDCLKANRDNDNVFYVIAGSGTQASKVEEFIRKEKPGNVRYFGQLPKDEYEELANSCDVGLIFLNKLFTIPNFPSRILSYMQASIPVLAATDINTDIGKVVEDGRFGYWCESSDAIEFNKKVPLFYDRTNRQVMGQDARKYLEDNYTANKSYQIIIGHFEGEVVD